MTVSVDQIFSDILDITKNLDPANNRKWFDQLYPLRFSGGSLCVGCPDETTMRFLRDNCRQSFTRAAQQVTGHLVTVEFSANSAAGVTLHPSQEFDALKLHPDYTFPNFVVGPSNRLAHASCVAVTQSPGNTYNPLFIYGNSGLGKTHLLQAVCSETLSHYANAVIRLLSCENFINLFIHAIESGDLVGFQNKFRNVDMLVIDDIQFLSEREQSQEEFFHTFNALYNNGKQIILSADCSPAEIAGIEDRLISRFNWGLVTRIDPPSHDTRVAILKKKAHLRGLDTGDDVAEFIARKVQANIRELEGALTTIYAVSTTTNSSITVELAQTALRGQIESAVRHTSISDIIDVVTKYFDVRLSDLQSKKRNQSITVPRQICMFLARQLTKHSLEEIGGHLGGRDNTTVMHACGKIDRAQSDDPKINSLLKELTRQITNEKE